MLRYLQIENIALIEKLALEPCFGLNVLTGETGAGKSIIIDSIQAVLGGRVSRELIRIGADKATIEAVFDIPEKSLNTLKKMGIDCDDDSLILFRELNSNGKSICRVNGRLVNVSALNEIGQQLVDMHGQHDNQSLLRPALHLTLMDNFCGQDLTEKLVTYRTNLADYRKKFKELNELKSDSIARERKTDLLKYQINEISAAEVKLGEDLELESKRTLMRNASKVREGLIGASALMSEEQINAIDLLSDTLLMLQQAASYSEEVESLHNRLSDQYYILEDISRELKDLNYSFDFSEKDLEEIEERLNIINQLKKKYGPTLEDVEVFLASAIEELEKTEISPEKLEELEKEVEEQRVKLENDALAISQLRKKAASLLEKHIEEELSELEMKGAAFSVNFTKTELTENGIDKAEFMFSANRGEPLKSLSKIASGGEMSRVMLAIKSILAQVDSIPLLIFDEIDSGISGVAAQKVGERLKGLTKTHQVICVTHHAQIAAMADQHYFVSKAVQKGKTKTDLNKLTGEERSLEIARLLSGADITEISKQHAEELLQAGAKY